MGAPFTVGFFARIAPEKGLHALCEAYRRLRERGELAGSRIEAAGVSARLSTSRICEAIESQMKDWGLADEFHYRGVLDRQQEIEFLQSVDVLSVPATYDEPKGAFSVGRDGLWSASCTASRRGAFTEVVERTREGFSLSPMTRTVSRMASLSWRLILRWLRISDERASKESDDTTAQLEWPIVPSKSTTACSKRSRQKLLLLSQLQRAGVLVTEVGVC